VLKLKVNNLVRYSIFACALLVSALIIPPLRKPALNILKLPLVAGSFIAREITGLIFFHRNMMAARRLITENDNLKRKILEQEEYRLENDRLKNLLSLKQKMPLKVIAAQVIARSADSWVSLIIINKGTRQGIRKGYVVITFAGLAGRVIEVSDLTSKVMLINDPHLGVSAIIERTRQEGLVSGTLGNTLIMRYLPKDADIQPGDKIITSGLTEMYPKGLAVGTVVSFGDEFSGLSRYAIVKPEVALGAIEDVLVVAE